MKIENLSEKNVLKLVVVTLFSIMLLTVAVVLSFNLDILKDNFFDKQVETLTLIPDNEENVLRVVFTGVSSPLTPHIAQQSVVISINNKNYVFDAGSRSTANFISQGTLDAAFIECFYYAYALRSYR